MAEDKDHYSEKDFAELIGTTVRALQANWYHCVARPGQLLSRKANPTNGKVCLLRDENNVPMITPMPATTARRYQGTTP